MLQLLHKHVEFNGGSGIKGSTKKKSNGTVNLSGNVQSSAISGDRLRKFPDEGHLDIVTMEVIQLDQTTKQFKARVQKSMEQ